MLIGEDGAPFFDKSKPIAYLIRGKSWVNNHAHVLRAKSDITSNLFLKWFLDGFDFNGHVNGTTRLKLTQGAMNEIPVLLPPLNEQRRIVAKLEELLARVEASQQRLAKIPVILKRFRQSVLAAACSGRLTADWREENPDKINASDLANQVRLAHEAAGGHKAGNAAPPTDGVHDLSAEMFPGGWELLTLREAVSPTRPITYGILKPGPEYKDGIPYIRVADFPNDTLNTTSIRKTSPEMDGNFKRSKLIGDDLLLSIRGTVGRLVRIPSELEGANITQDSARLSIQSEMNRDFVLWFLRSELAQNRMKRAIKGVAVRGINIGDVRALQVPVPSVPEQQEIVRRVEALFKVADQIEARFQKAKAQVDRLTQSILAKAFRGELVPQDENDEPAAVLLERIRAERAKTEPKSRRKAAPRPRPKTYPMEPAPLPKAAEPSASYGETTVPQRILAAMASGKSYSRADLAGSLNLSTALWNQAIRQLKDQGLVQQEGEKRGARYRLASK